MEDETIMMPLMTIISLCSNVCKCVRVPLIWSYLQTEIIPLIQESVFCGVGAERNAALTAEI